MIHELKRSNQECPHCGHYQQLALGLDTADTGNYLECPVCCRNIHSAMEINEYLQQVQMFFADEPGLVP
ncbi:CPXCG motif-containing cysteine-rich protein [Thalassomonas haliotis]|uniref:CPXCG motif-containing cysteine-rich protein n=1 Tax=Thalassomonas haliotis TaxID=485448 RepID=A0ABY7VFQ9_9GAMM|nr:CPXCG motif-containing cysteine-rich protein [Thalassomonas haliotis]WDE11472.1 CPXCG motif-containing cysteine-rich protein [Thalassomonas haliotis]